MADSSDGTLAHPAAIWGVLGVLALLTQAVVRLSPMAYQPIVDGLSPAQWAGYVGFTVFMLYSEGYKGFHLQFSPRVVGRARYLAAHGTTLQKCLAPFFCMSLFHATKKRLIVSWSILVFVITAIIVVRFLAQPWRGMVDAGVVIGLAVGMLSILFFLTQAKSGRALPTSLDLPD